MSLENLVKSESKEVFKEWKHQKDTKTTLKGSYWPNLGLFENKKMIVMEYNTWNNREL